MAGQLSKILKQRIFLIAFVESKQIKRVSAQVRSLVALAGSFIFLIVFSCVCGIVSFKLVKKNYGQSLYIQELKSNLLQYTIQEAPPSPLNEENMLLSKENIASHPLLEESVAHSPQLTQSPDLTVKDSLIKKEKVGVEEIAKTDLGVKIIDILAVQSPKPNQTRIQFTLQRVATNTRKGAMLGTVCLAAFKKGHKKQAPPDWLSPHTSSHRLTQGAPPCEGGVSVKFNHLRPIDLPIPTDMENLGSVTLVYTDGASGAAMTQDYEITE